MVGTHRIGSIFGGCDRPEQVYSTIYRCMYEENLLERETKDIPGLPPSTIPLNDLHDPYGPSRLPWGTRAPPLHSLRVHPVFY